PCLARGGAARARLAPEVEDVRGYFKRRVAPAELLARALDLVGAERRAVHLLAVRFRGRAIADLRLAGDQRRAVGLLCGLDRLRDRFRIVAVDAQRVPAGRLHACDLI